MGVWWSARDGSRLNSGRSGLWTCASAALWRLACGLLLACCAACAGIPGAPPSAEELDRQVLLMLRRSGPAPLRPWDEPGSGYGASHARTAALRTASDLARTHHLRVLDDWPMPVLGVHCVVLDAGSAEDVSRVVAALNSDSRVAWAQRMGQFRTLGGSADAEGAAAAWRQLDALHRLSTGRRVVIAQVDTGVDLGHPALAGQWSDPQNFVGGGRFPGELHGTGVAGVIVAHGDTSVGIVGVAPGARLMPLRACWQAEAQGALCSSFTLAKSVQYALRHGARIINLSLAGPHDLLLERLIDSAVAAGAIVVAAAEEDAADPGFPASHPQVIAVARKASGASPRSMLIAPGDDVLTTAPHGTFAFLSGSSFAAAHITGLTALILELSPRLSAAQVASLLRDSSSATADAGGPKVIDPCAALTAVSHAAGQPMCARLDEPIARRAARF